MTSSQKSKGVSRRRFMTLAGGAAGLATMAAVGLFPEQGVCSTNVPEIDMDKITNIENETDVLVIGGGMAGLFAAVKAHDAGSKVMLVSKGPSGFFRADTFCKGYIRI